MQKNPWWVYTLHETISVVKASNKMKGPLELYSAVEVFDVGSRVDNSKLSWDRRLVVYEE